MSRFFVLPVFLSSLLAAGCASGPREPPRFGGERGSHEEHHGFGLGLGHVTIEIGSQPDDDVDPIEARNRAIEAVPDESPFIADRDIPHQPAAVTAPDPVHVAFDATAAQAALGAVDLSGCIVRGAPKGYGHARVTFGSDGHATRVVVDSPSGMPNDAVTCIGTGLGTATTPAFDGAPIVVGATFRLN
jgi:hypothetical protein